MSKHRATTTLDSTYRDLCAGLTENFEYQERNGKHRAIDAFTAVNDALKAIA